MTVHGQSLNLVPVSVMHLCTCKYTPSMGAQTPVTCKGPAVDYKRSLAAAAPVFKQARLIACLLDTSRMLREG